MMWTACPASASVVASLSTRVSVATVVATSMSTRISGSLAAGLCFRGRPRRLRPAWCDQCSR